VNLKVVYLCLVKLECEYANQLLDSLEDALLAGNKNGFSHLESSSRTFTYTTNNIMGAGTTGNHNSHWDIVVDARKTKTGVWDDFGADSVWAGTSGSTTHYLTLDFIFAVDEKAVSNRLSLRKMY